MIFEAMVEADLDQLAALEQQIYPFPWTRGNFLDSLKAGHACWLVREDKEIVAYAIVMQVLDEVHLLNISVVPSLQKSGRGTALLLHLFDRARMQGGARMFLEVRSSNLLAQQLYVRHGFIQIGQRRGYYPAHENREDAVVMAREL